MIKQSYKAQAFEASAPLRERLPKLYAAIIKLIWALMATIGRRVSTRKRGTDSMEFLDDKNADEFDATFDLNGSQRHWRRLNTLRGGIREKWASPRSKEEATEKLRLWRGRHRQILERYEAHNFADGESDDLL